MNTSNSISLFFIVLVLSALFVTQCTPVRPMAETMPISEATEFQNRSGETNAALEAEEPSAETEMPIIVTGEEEQPAESVAQEPILQEPAAEPGSWPMAAANPQRTSWSTEEVKGRLRPLWYRPIEPFIPARFQLVASDGLLLISTARGLYALDAENGAQRWVYPTELPLGNAPTIADGVAYVGGLDKKLHAVNAQTGQPLWTFEATAGFDTNPLVVGDKVLLGCRDGYFYAVYRQGEKTGQLAWKYKTAGPIHFSAAYKNGVVYFVSGDGRAYALSASTGARKWRSAILPGAGFHSWWPVVYGNYVIVAGSSGYRMRIPPGALPSQRELEHKCAFPNGLSSNTLVGTRRSDGWISPSRVLYCLEKYPWRRTYLVLSIKTGKEVKYDFDRDGKKDYAPMFWFGTYGGNRYPPLVGPDGLLYQSAAYIGTGTGFRGHVVGWKLGKSLIKDASRGSLSTDEPIAYSGGGKVIYWSQCCNRTAGGIDLSIADKDNPAREWSYFGYNLAELVPGYDAMQYSADIDAVYGGPNGVYGLHGDQSPPIPYRGKIYMIQGNAVIAFAKTNTAPVKLPLAATVNTRQTVTVDEAWLRQSLADEVQKIVNAGHLRPGYGISGNFDLQGMKYCSDQAMDYWHEPADMIIVLTEALPYLPANLQDAVRAYLQKEMASYPPYRYINIGWKDGASREYFVLPPDVNSARANMGPSEYPRNFVGYDFPPRLFYAMWKYAQVFGEAQKWFDLSKSRLEFPPGDDVLARMPFIHNAYIAGFTGYLELEKLAGYPESSDVRAELERLLRLRANNFSKDSPYGQRLCDPASMNGDCYCKTMNIARNFLFLTPELGQYLHDNARGKVEQAVNEYNRVAPYWFAAKFEQTYAEGVHEPAFDTHALFMAKALILQEPRNELIKYLDAPAFAVGDLYYIQNLAALLAAP